MRDEALRELERVWEESRDPESESAYLGALLRRGLGRERLLLAAYLGSEAALDHLGDRGFAEESQLGPWLRGLGRGRLARSPKLARTALARAVLVLVRTTPLGEREEVQAEVANLSAWLESPESISPAHVQGRGLEADFQRIPRQHELSEAANAAARIGQEAAKALKGVRGKHRHLIAGTQRELLPWVLASTALAEGQG